MEKDVFGEHSWPGRPNPYIQVCSADELWKIRQNRLTYRVIQIVQGNEGLVYVVDLLCIAYTIGSLD
jgi:hypothetical protein